MANSLSRELTKKQISAIYDGLAKAGLDDFRISSLHLKRRLRAVGAAPTNPSGDCHSTQLPNGDWVIVCD
jgi:hypothetical protein